MNYANSVPTVEEIVARATSELFGKKLLTNIHRAAVVEAIVAAALEPEWQLCSANYASCDFRRGNLRLEVKQTASLQPWNASAFKSSKCCFDIAERTGEWQDGIGWKTGPGRNADIYLLCHHPLVSLQADHRDPAQWRFFVILEVSLPRQKTVSLARVEQLATSVRWIELKRTVEEVAQRCSNKSHIT